MKRKVEKRTFFPLAFGFSFSFVPPSGTSPFSPPSSTSNLAKVWQTGPAGRPAAELDARSAASELEAPAPTTAAAGWD